MSPQPISRVKPGAFPIILPWSIAAFGETPKSLAVLVARVVMTWARCESTLALMMAAFLKADFGVDFAMLDALTSSEGRLAAITGAAREALPPHRFEVFQATLRVTKASRNRRNEYVHHIWAYTPQVSDGLLLIDPRLMARIEAEDQERMTRGESRVAQIGMGTLRPEDEANIFVYRDVDIRRDLDDAFDADHLFLSLKTLLWTHPEERFAERLRVLLNEHPKLQQALPMTSNENTL